MDNQTRSILAQMANRRAMQLKGNVGGSLSGGLAVVGGKKYAQTQGDKEDEKLAMEVHGLEDVVKPKKKGRGRPKKQTKKDKRHEAEGTKEFEAGVKIGKALLKKHKALHGGGFWGDVWSGIKSVAKPVASVVKAVAPMVAPGPGHVVSAGLGALGAGKKKRGGKVIGGKVTGGSKAKRRGALISKLMKSKGMSLGQASKYIKEKGLKY